MTEHPHHHIEIGDTEAIADRAMEVLAERPSALVTDVDGTLSRIVARPEDAKVGETARAALRRLMGRLDLVAVITGREQDVARRMVGIEELTYIGSYALTSLEVPIAVSLRIEEAIDAVQPHLHEMPCVTFERKDVSFALHYRNCEDQADARRRVIALLDPIAHSEEAKLLEGKAVIEVAPALLPDKGTAFRELADSTGTRGSIFIGDDVADTTIFRVIARRRARGIPGLSIGVVDNETPPAVYETTDVQVRGVDGVESLLQVLADRLGG